MNISHYTDVPATHIDNDKAKGIDARVVIGKKEGANNFYMRIFALAAEGHTPKHTHDWEHEIFIQAGEGEIYNQGKWVTVKAGSIAFIPGNEEHQIRNSGKNQMVFVCLVPATAPEL